MIGVAVALALLFFLLTLVSYAERVYMEIGRFLSREFQENISTFEQKVEPRLGVSRARAALSAAPAPRRTAPDSPTPCWGRAPRAKRSWA